MIPKALAALVAAPFVLSASPVIEGPKSVNFGAIKLIRCGTGSGTAWQATPTLLITAAHVTRHAPCTIDGIPVPVVHESEDLDFAAVSGSFGKPLAYSCRPAVRGRTYFGIGYAAGIFRMDSRLIAKGRISMVLGRPSLTGMVDFQGGIIPGMSGGPIVDKAGRVVAIVNTTSPLVPSGLGRSVADSFLCAKRVA